MKQKSRIKNQCECIVTYANPFTIGGAALTKEQCHKRGIYAVTEKSTKDRMPLCGQHTEGFRKRNKGELKLYKIERIKK